MNDGQTVVVDFLRSNLRFRTPAEVR